MALDTIQTVTGAAALRLLDQVSDPELLAERAGDPPRVLLHEGDLRVKGDLTLPLDSAGPHVLVVQGNLSVTGIFRDSGEPGTATVVTGNLQADVLVCSGTLEVAGDLTARVVVGGDSDLLCRVGERLQAELFYSEEHFFEAKAARIGRAVGNRYRLDLARGNTVDFVDGDDRDILGILVDDVLVVERDDDDDIVDLHIDHGAFLKRVLAGKAVLRVEPDSQ